MKFKFKKDAWFRYDCDFWYDLIYGGYIDPKEVLEGKILAKKVIEAAELVHAFQEAYESAAEKQAESEKDE